MIQNTFKRYEIKYLINRNQKQRILDAIKPYMSIDGYGRSTIRNIYYDTDSYRLVRRSLEKPEYKEKLRLRTYQKADDHCESFVEIKKKYDSIVYKRRTVYPLLDAENRLKENVWNHEDQINKEIEYFIKFYKSF